MAFLFQDWQVYKDARLLRREVGEVLKTYPIHERFALTDQTRRAMLSVMLEVAEGSNRTSGKDKALFVNRAFTSLYEVLACFDCALDDKYISEEQYKIFYQKIENIAKQLRGLEKHFRAIEKL
jgi:four helix bundle protein